MTHSTQPSWEDWQELIEAATGIDIKELLKDDERYITFTEVSNRMMVANHLFGKTGDPKYLKAGDKAASLLKAMVGKARAEGKYLHLKPSELDKLLSPN